MEVAAPCPPGPAETVIVQFAKVSIMNQQLHCHSCDFKTFLVPAVVERVEKHTN
jgi:hypothetical protein